MILYHGRGFKRSSPVKIFIATPTYSSPTAAYTHSLFNAVHALEKHGVGCELALYTGNCHVDDGRNALVAEFMKSDCTDLVFIDADLMFTGEDLAKLAKHDRDVVAGVYPKKQDDADYPVWLPTGGLWADDDGLLEALAVPTGFLKISRHAIDAVTKIVPKYAPNSGKSAEIPLIFERSRDGAVRVGGDYEFCRKWRSIGGKIYVDPEMEFSHIGVNDWSGSLQAWLLEKNGMQDELIKSMLFRLKNGEEIDFSKLFKQWGNHWSAEPEYLATASCFAKEADTPIIECGAGLSTLVAGASTKQDLYVLEQGYKYAAQIQKWVEKLGLTNVHMYHCPVLDYGKFRWYELPELPKTNLVLCDGPKRSDGRYGLYPALHESLNHGCKILMDDFDTEESTVKAWGIPYQKIGKNIAVAEVK